MLRFCPPGEYMIVILDGHGYTINETFPTLPELRAWMKVEDPGYSFHVSDDDWKIVGHAMQEQNVVYLKTGADVDIVISHCPPVPTGI